MGISGSDLSLQYALCGVMRCGASRCGDTSAKVFVKVDGVVRDAGDDGGVNLDLSINEQLGQGANTATLRGIRFDPQAGHRVEVTLGSENNGDPTFAGTLGRASKYQLKPGGEELLSMTASDYTWLANKTLVTKRYVNMSGSDIGRDLVSSFAPGFSSAGIADDLPVLDEFTLTNESFSGSMQRLADRIGGYALIGYNRKIWLYVDEPAWTAPATLSVTHPTMREFRFASDITSVITRAIVEGAGSTALNDVTVGDTIMPVADATAFNEFGGTVASGPQSITYTGKRAGGSGSVVGPGVTPSSPPTVAPIVGSGVESGLHKYAYSWVTAAGETPPSSLASVTMGAVDPPTRAPLVYNAGSGGQLVAGGSYQFALTFCIGASHTFETTKGPLASLVAGACLYPDIYPSATSAASIVIAYGSSNPSVTHVGVYRTTDGGATFYFLGFAPNYVDGYSQEWGTSDAAIVSNPAAPSSNTAEVNQADVSGIAPGPSGTTARKVWRTAANASQLKLLATLADNTTTVLSGDNTPDASLGANAPTSDTSGLTQPTGQANAGATSLTVAGTSWASSSGGWAILGNGAQVVRYTGITATSLTGIPASGVGALAAPVPYNTTITAAPCLSGIPTSGDGSIVYAITKGDDVNLLAQSDDEGAQATLAALLDDGTSPADDGIREGYIQDRRLSFAEATARGQALLEQRSTAQVTVTYKSRDRNTKVGRLVTVDDVTGVSGTFRIQSVRIAEFSATPVEMEPANRCYRFPLYDVTASNQRYSLNDLLRQIKNGQNA